MTDQAPNPQDEQKAAQVTWLLWGSMFASIAIYAVLVFMGFIPASPMEEGMRTVVTGVLAMQSMAMLAVVTAMRRLLAKKLPYQTYSLVRWALCDAIAIFGIVQHTLGAPRSVVLAFFGMGAVGMLLCRPDTADYEEARKE